MDAQIIDNLAVRLSKARMAEANARDERIAVEELLIAAIGAGESERKTIKTDVGLKLVVQSGLSYKLDKDADPSLVPIKQIVKNELDTKAYEHMRETDPQAFAKASQFVTVTPKKTSVTLTVA